MIGRACVTLALALASGATGVSVPSSAGSMRTCATSALKVRVVHTGVAAGTVGGYIGFTNTSRATCRLSGWPTLVAISAAGGSTTAVHRRSTMFGPRPNIRGVPVVTLRRGERADAVFTAGDGPGPGKRTCPPSYQRLRVTPPGNSRGVLVSAWLSGLDAFLPACTAIDVSMVVPASALYRG